MRNDKFRKGFVLGIIILILTASVVLVNPTVKAGTTVYANDRLGWESAVGSYNEEFFSDTTLNPGVSVVSDNGYVHSAGYWWDRVDDGDWGDPGTTTWSFSFPITAWGGTFDTAGPGGPGSSIVVELVDGTPDYVGTIPNTIAGTFWGFVSDTSFVKVHLEDAELINWACETYTMDNMVYSTGGNQPLYINGIDISENQGNIDWKMLSSNSDVIFSFIKASSGKKGEDYKFDYNMIEATKNGIYAGAYHFAYPIWKNKNGDVIYNSAIDEANWFLKHAKKYITNGHLRPVLDLENDPNLGAYPRDLGVEGLTQWINTFMDKVKTETGITPIIYTGNEYATFLDDSIDKYDLWFARWGCNIDNPPTNEEIGIWSDKGWDFWQYYGPGDPPYYTNGCGLNTIPGVEDPNYYGVDLDVFNGDLTQLKSFVIGGGENHPRFPVDNPTGDPPAYWYHYPGSGSDHNYGPYEGGHHPGGGIGHADDTYALDLNWGSGDNDRGKTVYAIEDGEIKDVDKTKGWVLIEHNNNLLWKGQVYNPWYSGYLHMEKIPKLQVNDVVKKSVKIGEVGKAGNTKSAHLHFAIYIGKISPNPWRYGLLDSVDPGQVGGQPYSGFIYGDYETIYQFGRGAIYNHNVDELLYHDSMHQFIRSGNEQDWYESFDYGYFNHIFYSLTRKYTEKNSALWIHKILIEGDYRVFVFVPRNYATSTNVIYQIFKNDEIQPLREVIINQNKWTDKWVQLGLDTLHFVNDDEIKIKLTDKTGEDGKYLAFDSVKIWMKQDLILP